MLKISGRIPITIHPVFWILAAIIGWINTLSFEGTIIWTLIILASVLIHEFGHALTAIFFGQTATIELVAFGGVTQRHGGKASLWKEFIIVLNGPLAGLLLSGFAWIIQGRLVETAPHATLTYVFVVTFYVNLFWTIVNLLPIQPLDGGKLLTIFLESLFGLKGAKVALFISMFLAGILSLAFFATQNIFAGALFFLFAFEGYRSWKSSLIMTEQDQNFILQHLLHEAERDIHQGRKQDAIEKLNRIRELSQTGVIFMQASELEAILLTEQGETEKAYEILAPLGSKLDPDSLRLLHQLAYRQGDWKNAIALGDKAYQVYPSYDIALINAISHSILGHVRPAIGWLQCAIREGVPNLREVLEKREFDAIRNDPLFQQIKNQTGESVS